MDMVLSGCCISACLSITKSVGNSKNGGNQQAPKSPSPKAKSSEQRDDHDGPTHGNTPPAEAKCITDNEVNDATANHESTNETG